MFKAQCSKFKVKVIIKFKVQYSKFKVLNQSIELLFEFFELVSY